MSCIVNNKSASEFHGEVCASASAARQECAFSNLCLLLGTTWCMVRGFNSGTRFRCREIVCCGNAQSFVVSSCNSETTGPSMVQKCKSCTCIFWFVGEDISGGCSFCRKTGLPVHDERLWLMDVAKIDGWAAPRRAKMMLQNLANGVVCNFPGQNR